MEEIIKNILQIDKEAIEKQERTKQVLEEKENQKKALLKNKVSKKNAKNVPIRCSACTKLFRSKVHFSPFDVDRAILLIIQELVHTGLWVFTLVKVNFFTCKRHT